MEGESGTDAENEAWEIHRISDEPNH